MANPYAQFARPQQSAMGASAVIQGPPREPPPRDGLDTQKTLLDIQAAQEKLQRDRAEYEEQKRKDAANGGLTEGQAKGTNFYSSALEANTQFESMVNGPQKMDPDTGIGHWAHNSYPNVTNVASKWMDGAEQADKRSAYRQAVDNFIRASLRLESGAAIGAEEYERQYSTFFPLEGAGPKEIEAKRRARQVEIEGLKTGAGPGAATVQLPPTERPDINSLQSQDMTPETPKLGPRLTPEQEADLKAFLATKPNAAQIQGRYASYGVGNIDPEQAQHAADYYAKGGNQFGGVDYSKVDEAAQAEARAKADELERLHGKDDAATLLTQGASLGNFDELAGVGGMLLGDKYETNRDAQRILADRARGRLGGVGTAIEIGGGLLTANPTSMAASGLTLPQRMAAGARVGAINGSIAGFGYGEGPQSVPNALVGAGVGATVGGTLPVVGNALSRFAKPVSQESRALAQASVDENVPISRAFVDPSQRNKLTYLETTKGGNAPIREGMAATSDAIEGRVTRLEQGKTPLDNEAGGSRIQEAAHAFIAKTRGVKDRLYSRAEQKAGNVTFVPQGAIQQADAIIADLERNPSTNKGLIAYIKELRSDLASGPKTLQDVRAIRTGIRGQINERGLTMSGADAHAASILDAAKQDITGALSNNPGALAAYNRADQYYAERQGIIKTTLSRFIDKDGRISPERAFERLKNMAKPSGDARRFQRMMQMLDPDEQAEIAATFAHSLGRGTDDAFSPAKFVTKVSELSPQARRAMFGADGAQSIDNLVRLSTAYRDVQRNLNNSRSGVAFNYRSLVGTISGLLGGGAGYLSAGPGGGLTGAAVGMLAAKGAANVVENTSNKLSARALMNPKVSQWLLSAPVTRSPAAIQAHFAKLNAIIAREPALAGELQGFQQRLIEAGRGMPSPASTPDAKQDVKQRR
jgi:hypothetical protein